MEEVKGEVKEKLIEIKPGSASSLAWMLMLMSNMSTNELGQMALVQVDK